MQNNTIIEANRKNNRFFVDCVKYKTGKPQEIKKLVLTNAINQRAFVVMKRSDLQNFILRAKYRIYLQNLPNTITLTIRLLIFAIPLLIYVFVTGASIEEERF